MLFNIVIGGIILVYSAWALARYYRKSRQGKCAACDMNDSCRSHCSE